MLIGFNWVNTHLILGVFEFHLSRRVLVSKQIWVDFATPSVIQIIKGFSTMGGAFVIFQLLVFILMFWGVFSSFFMFWGCIGHFLGFRCVLDIFLSFQGHFGHLSDLQGYFFLIQVIDGILANFRYKGYFGHFRCLKGCLGHFLCFGGISVIY